MKILKRYMMEFIIEGDDISSHELYQKLRKTLPEIVSFVGVNNKNEIAWQMKSLSANLSDGLQDEHTKERLEKEGKTE